MALLPPFFVVQVAFAPLPFPLMQALREIEVETAVGQASVFRLHFDLSRNFMGDFDVLALDLFRPLVPITIRVASGLGIPQPIVNGFIRSADLAGANKPGGSTLEVVGMDKLGTLMALIQQPFTWPNMPDSVVAMTIFGKYACAPVVIPTPPTRTVLDATTTQHANDATYLMQLAQRNGYQLYIQPDPVVGIDMGHFHPPMLPPMPPQGVLSIDFGKQTNLNSFHVGNDMLKPTSVITASVDPHTRAPIPALAPVSTDIPMGMEPTLNRIIPPPIERSFGNDAANPAETQMQALSRATSSSRSVRCNGEVDGVKFTRPLMVGMPVLVRGAGREHSGLYYVETVTHHITRDNYTQSFTGWRNAVGLTGAEVFVDPFAAVA